MTWDRKAFASITADAAKGLADAAEFLLDESTRVAPIEEGTLIRSATATVDPAKLEAVVSYDTPYAVRQHEDLDARHDPGRQAKYLEEPLRSRANTILKLIAEPIRKGMA